jgi:hypothetical protein
MKKLVFGLIIIFSLIGVSCSSASNIEQSATSVITEPPPGPADRPLQVTNIPNPQGYLPGQQVEIKLQFSNIGPESITINRFPPEFRIISREWKTIYSAEAGSEKLQLKPGETKTYNITWNQQDENGNQVSSGLYRADIKNITYVHDISKRTTTANFGDTWFNILFPQGAMKKTIELNTSQTVDGFSITLESVELSSKGSIFHCFFVPPSDVSTEPDAYAKYTFDGTTIDAGSSGWGSRDNGFRLVWGSTELPLNPVPSNTKELTFTITRLYGREGPWEFEVPLK